MKNNIQLPTQKKIQTPNKKPHKTKENIFELCIKKGLIEKTEYGYYFKPEFFETLDIYSDE
jgi:hypothetical protein